MNQNYNLGLTIIDYNDTTCSLDEDFKLTYASDSLDFNDLDQDTWSDLKTKLIQADIFLSLGPPGFRVIFVTDGRSDSHPGLIRSARVVRSYQDLKKVHDYYRQHNVWPGMRQDDKYIYEEQRSSLTTFKDLLLGLDSDFFSAILE